MVIALLAGVIGCGEAPYPDYWTGEGPEITSVSIDTLDSPVGGDGLVIYGSGLATTRSVVIGGRNAEIVDSSDTSVSILLPHAAPGVSSVDVTVVTDNGMSRLTDGITYTSKGRDWWAVA